MTGKLIVALILTALSSSAAAEWVEVNRTDDLNVTVYADLASIRRKGNMVKMWDLLDLKTAKKSASGVTYLSSRTQYQYNCKYERGRVLYVSLHSGQMGNGEVVYSDADPDKWQPVPPGSVIETLWKVACGKQ